MSVFVELRGHIGWLYAAILVMVASCANPDIIPQRKLVKILADIHSIDAATGSDYASEGLRYLSRSDTVALYQPIIRSYGYTHEQFQQTLIRYAYSTSKAEKMYDKVIEELKKREKDAQEAVERLHREQDRWTNALKQGERHWGKDTSKAIFTLPVEGLGDYVLTAQIQLGDTVLRPRITLELYTENLDSLLLSAESPLVQVDTLREYSVKVTNADTLARMLKGYLLNSDPDTVTVDRQARVGEVRLRFVPAAE